MFLRNFWYVAACGHEVTRNPLGRVILGEPIVFFRREDGTPVALEDRCAHRGYPLSKGRLDGDLLVCGYHGLRYDTAGACVGVPSQPNVPYGVCVRAYPVREASPFVWIWLTWFVTSASVAPSSTRESSAPKAPAWARFTAMFLSVTGWPARSESTGSGAFKTSISG